MAEQSISYLHESCFQTNRTGTKETEEEQCTVRKGCQITVCNLIMDLGNDGKAAFCYVKGLLFVV